MNQKIVLVLLLAARTLSTFSTDLSEFFEKKHCDPKCTFDSRNLSSKTIDSFPTTCSTVCTDLQIGEDCDLTEAQLTSTFLNMKRLIGNIFVVSTKFKSGSFLAGLESIECNNFDVMWVLNNQMLEIGLTNLTSISCVGFQVTENKKLARLNMPNLKNITLPEFPKPNDKNTKLKFHSESPDFCITIEEIENFITANITNVDEISGKYCTPTNHTNLCMSPSLCQKVFGDVEVGPNTNLDSIKMIEIIFGSLIINGTNVTDFNFLENLKYVASFTADKSGIIVEKNPTLQNISFPKLKRVRASNPATIVFDKNNKNLSLDVDSCYGLKNALGITTDWSPTIDGNDCYSINRTFISIKPSKLSEKLMSPSIVFFIFAAQLW